MSKRQAYIGEYLYEKVIDGETIKVRVIVDSEFGFPVVKIVFVDLPEKVRRKYLIFGRSGSPLSEVRLFTSLNYYDRYVYIVDLTGKNDQGAPINRKGLGTLVFNVALNFFKRFYDDHIYVIGDLPNDESVKNRLNFWSRFGFKFTKKNGQGFIKMQIQLSELKNVNSNSALDGLLPINIPFADFRHNNSDFSYIKYDATLNQRI